MNKVSVSTLPMDFLHIDVDLMRVSTADYLHIDVMDGKFVELTTVGVDEVRNLETDLVRNVHLMIENPEDHVEEFIDAGGEIINFHFEATDNPQKVIDMIRKKGAKAGLSVNPGTSFAKIKPFLKDLDQVMVMAVQPGEGGQDFMPKVIDKIRKIREFREDLDIEVDGGINEATGEQCIEAGANILCSGSYVFKFDDPKIGIDILRNI